MPAIWPSSDFSSKYNEIVTKNGQGMNIEKLEKLIDKFEL